MRTAAIAVVCALLVSVARPECVEVGKPKPEESSKHVRLAVVLGGRPQEGVRVNFYQGFGKPLFTATTDRRGIATLRKVAPGDYNVVAVLDDNVTTSLWMRVIPKHDQNTLSMDLTWSFSRVQEMMKAAENLPIRSHVQAFQGNVIDPSGAIVAGANIKVMRKGSEHTVVLRVKSDANGYFADDLAAGSYIAFIFEPGFRTAIVPFEVTKAGTGNLQVTLQIGQC